VDRGVCFTVTELEPFVADSRLRRRLGLPPWAPQLSTWQRALAHWIERGLYALLFAMPFSGFWLIFVSDDAVGLHVAAHITLFVVAAAHVIFVATKRLLPRML